MENLLGELERALEYSIADVEPHVRASAKAFVDNVRAMPDMWKMALVKIFESKSELLFFWFQLVEDLFLSNRYRQLQDAEKGEIRRALLTYLSERLCNPQANPSTSFFLLTYLLSRLTRDLAHYVKKRVSQLLVLLFREEFPHKWPSFFDDLFRAVAADSNGFMTEMFLHIMIAIDDEVVSMEVPRSPEDLQRNSILKDQIREKAVEQIVNVWYHIITKHAGGTNQQRNLASLALQAIAIYTGWIDINLVANERMMNVYVQLLNSEHFARNIMQVFEAIVNKGMSRKDKLFMIANLKLPEILKTVKINDDDDQVELFVSFASLVNNIGLELIEVSLGIEDLQINQTASAMLSDMVVFLFQFLNHPDDEVSESVIDFATQYIHYIRSQVKERGGHIDATFGGQLKQFLQVISFKCRFDENFDFLQADMNEEAFLQYRKTLSNIFKLITQFEPQMVANVVLDHLQALKSMSPQEAQQQQGVFQIEVSLWMFYKMGEGLTEEVLLQTKQFFVSTLESLAASPSSLSYHPHPAISNIYFNIVGRYARLLQGNQNALQQVLASLFDQRGIRSARKYTRSKCCDLLVRVVRINALRNDLGPMTPMIVDAVKDLLRFNASASTSRQSSPVKGAGTFNLKPTNGAQSPDGLDFDDQLNLFEALGVLIGQLSTETLRADQGRFMESILSNAIENVGRLVTGDLLKQDPDERYLNAFCNLVRAIGTFSKGFPQNSSKSSENVVKFFVPTMQHVMTAMKTYPRATLLRQSAMFYMHRMIGCLGPAIGQYLPTIITLFMNEAGTNELSESVLIINQIMSTFKEDVFDVVDQLLMPLIEHIFKHIQQVVAKGITLKSEEERELVNLRKNYYVFIQTIARTIPNVFLSPRNLSKLHDVLETVVEGCKFYADTNIQLLCVGVFRKLVMTWGVSNEHFASFFFQRLLRMTFEVPSSKQFNLEDGITQNVLLEISNLLQDMYKKAGPPLIQYLTTVFFPQIKPPPAFVQAYLHHVTNAGYRDLRDFLRQFYLQNQS